LILEEFLFLDETFCVDVLENFFYFCELVAISRHYFAMVERIFHFKLSEFVDLVLGFLVKYAILVSQIDSKYLLVKLPAIESQQLHQNHCHILLLLKLC
jgi:hypothetical protein